MIMATNTAPAAQVIASLGTGLPFAIRSATRPTMSSTVARAEANDTFLANPQLITAYERARDGQDPKSPLEPPGPLVASAEGAAEARDGGQRKEANGLRREERDQQSLRHGVTRVRGSPL